MDELKDGTPYYGVAYVSCMKLNGVPLLPPLMTPEYRQEMQYYKQLAMAVDRRLNDLKFCLDETTINSNVLHSDSEEWFDGVNISMVSSKSDQNNEMSDWSKHEYLNNNCDMKLVFVENNDFESINSQLTVIDNNEEYLKSFSVNSPARKEIKATLSNTASRVNSRDNVNEKVEENFASDLSIDTSLQSDKTSSPLKKSMQNQITKSTLSKDFNISKPSLPERQQLAKNVMTKSDSTKLIYSNENLKHDNSSSRNISKSSTVTTSPKYKKSNINKKESLVGGKGALGINKKSYHVANNKDSLNLRKIPKDASTIDSKNKLSPSKNVTGSLNNISSGLTSPPKLVRQNSYTLEYPSPLLLAHLEVQSLASGVELQSISMSESTSTSHLNHSKQKCLDSNTAKEIWSSLGSDINSLSLNENYGIPLKNKECDENNKRISYIDSGCENKVEVKSDDLHSKNHSDQLSSKMSSSSVLIDEKSSEAPSHNIVNSESEPQNFDTIDQITDNRETNTSSTYLKYVLKKFEEDHAKKLDELMKKQKEEQILLKKNFENQQRMLLAQFKLTHKKDTDDKNIDPEVEIEKLKILADNSTKEITNVQSGNDSFTKSVNPELYEKFQDIDNVDKYLQMSENVLQKSRNIRNQKLSTKPPCNKYPSDVSKNKVLDSKHVKSNNDKNITLHNVIDKNKENPNLMTKEFYESSEIQSLASTKDKSLSALEADENNSTARSANTLDDINFTFASDVSSKGSDKMSQSNTVMKDIDGMSKLKSAFDKITKIQQNLASQPPRYFQNYISNKSYEDDDCLSITSQTISLSSIGTISQLYSEPENHHSIVDRNALSLNLVDINRPHNNKHLQQYIFQQQKIVTEKEIIAATKIVAHAKGFLTRRLMKTEKVESIVQTIRDTLLCALQLHRDEKGIQGPDVDLHRRLIQQITAACYALHDMFIVFTPAERMNVIAQDRERKLSLSFRNSSSGSSVRQLSATTQKILKRKLEGMSKSHSGVFTSKSTRNYSSNQMTRSHYDHESLKAVINYRPRRTITVAGENGGSRKPWR